MSSVAAVIEQAQGNKGNGQQQRPQSNWKPEWNVSTFLVCSPQDPDLSIYEIPEASFVGKDYAGYVAMQISKSNHRDFPGHRFCLGAILPDGRFVLNISPRVEGQRQGSPSIDTGVWGAASVLLLKSQSWQESDVAVQVDRFVVRTSGRDDRTQAAPRGIGKPGKTERERAKGKAKPKRD